mmetsp:Transcript_18795/g.36827  ORF Transcript_18795/g.36827 Transcript_18795/m.36827 type:complete len:992 (+) Transcript_18795:115-3090(+)
MERPTLVIMGMRGAGKSTLGRIGASALGYVFVDMDEVLESEQGRPCGEIVASEGWDGFRALELLAFRNTLLKHPEGAVISCGGGIVETQEARDLLKTLSNVIFVDRHIQDICIDLEANQAREAASKSATPSPSPIVSASTDEAEDATEDGASTGVAASDSLARRPQYDAGVLEVYERRLPWFLECLSHRFPILLGDRNWARVSCEFESFATAIFAEPAPSPLLPNARIHLASSATEVGQLAAAGADAVWLAGAEPLDQWPAKVAMTRRRTVLPVVVDAGGDVQLAALAMQLGAECVAADCVEVVEQSLQAVLPRWTGSTVFALRVAAKDLSSEDAIIAAVSKYTGTALSEAASRIAMLVVTAPKIADAMEAVRLVAALDRIINGKVSGITLPKVAAFMLDVAGAEGDGVPLAQALVSGRCGPSILPLTPAAAVRLREDLPVNPEQHYCLIGGAIRSSPSPVMHNAGFKALGMASRYTLCETKDAERIQTVIGAERFRGASVTMPHKELVRAYMDTVSNAAERIGAINTVVKNEKDELHGDNTDWYGLYQLAKNGIEARSEKGLATSGAALLLGAGGTALAAAYCVEQLGLRLFVWNRSRERAEKLTQAFPGTVVDDLDAFDEPVDLIIGLVPASSGLCMPHEAFLRKHEPVVVDVAYRPRQTALLKQAASCGCITYEGIDMLVEQGLMQMSLWSGIPVEHVPRREMECAARNFYADTDPACERYYLFGHPIGASPSPTFHNQGFQDLRMTRYYSLCESLDIKVVENKVKEPSFRGASVTIPHKESVAPFLDELSPAAESIGAVNTIARRQDGTLFGDNTDWQGIRALLESSPRLSSIKNDGAGPAVLLVIGAGGTALAASYCAIQMGLQLIVYNRTYEKAAAVADRFGGSAVRSLEEIPAVDCIVGTVPSGAGFTAPEHLLASKPVVLDAAYRPRRTKLLQQAAQHGCETFEGIQMLIEQGIAQFKLWTGCEPPRTRMEEAVYAFYVQGEI